jgi:hypothetical protein
LFVITDIAADAERSAAGVLDFKMTQIEFGLAPRQQADASALGGEPDRQPLSNTAPCAGH